MIVVDFHNEKGEAMGRKMSVIQTELESCGMGEAAKQSHHVGTTPATGTDTSGTARAGMGKVKWFHITRALSTATFFLTEPFLLLFFN